MKPKAESLIFWIISAWILLCSPSINASNSPQELATGDLSISMVNVGEFPKYGVNIPFNITVTNNGSADVFDVGVINYMPAGYQFGNNPDWTLDPMVADAYTTTISGPIEAGQSVIVTINLMPIAASDSLDWVNAAEIFEFRDAIGGNICTDINSTNDKIKGNDTPGEDDYAEQSVPIFDLAVRKVLHTPPPYQYGQDLVFRTYVFNQGNTPATQVTLIDYIPEGYQYDFAVNSANGWSNSMSNTPTVTLPNTLFTGQVDSVDITLRLTNEMFDERAWNNYSELFSASDDMGIDRSSVDSDSETNSNTTVENNVLPGSADDDNINGGGPLAGEDEDDHDPAAPPIYDLALEKVLFTALPSFAYGQDAEFTNTVINQGNQLARNVEIVDYVPCGFDFDPAANPGWTFTPSTRIAHYTFPGDLLPNTAISQNLILEVVACFENQQTAWDNYGEVAGALTADNTPFVDIDSALDSIPDNDIGAVPDGPSDGQTDGIAIPDGEDEDDHDVKRVQVVDLALIKIITNSGPFEIGDTVDFAVRVYNQGNVLLDSIRVKDYMPDGYVNPPGLNPDWTADGTDLVRLIPPILMPEDSVTVPLRLQLAAAMVERDYYNYAEIIGVQDTTTSIFNNRFDDADSFVGTDSPAERSVVPDGPNDDNILENSYQGGDSDDHDVAGPIFYDLALDKRITPPSEISYGTQVTFDIIVSNQGTQVANSFQVTDYLPCGYTFVEGANPGWTLDPGTGYYQYTSNTSLTPGASQSLSLVVAITECNNGTADAFTNKAEISLDDGDDQDSDPDSDPENDPEEEDDIDEESLPIADLALSKELAAPNADYSVGDDITFNITVTNEGNTIARNIKVVDYLPCGYTFDAASNTGWTLNATTNNPEYTIAGDLAAGASETVAITLTIVSCDSGGVNNYLNGSEIVSADDEMDMPYDDIDSTPDDTQGNDPDEEDDYDDTGIDIYDLELSKEKVSEPADLSYGDIIGYEITVTNRGNVTANMATVTDYIPCGMAYEAVNNSLNWNVDGTTGHASYALPSALEPGESQTLSIVLTLEECNTPSVARAWNNVAEISEDDGDDDDSTPDDDPDNDPEDEDDIDDAPTPIFDLALTKFVLNEQAEYDEGDMVTFNIVVSNQGNQTATNIEVIDYVPCGLTFANLSNPGWIAAGSNMIHEVAQLLPGQDTTLNITFTVQDCNNFAEAGYINVSEIASADDEDGNPSDDIDSTPDTNPNNDPDGEDDIDDATINVPPPTINIGGDVWKDEDRDGIYDTTEEGVPGIPVNLLDCNGNVIASTTTGVTGFYVFVGYESQGYTIEFDISGLNGECVFTTPNVGNDDTRDSDALANGRTSCVFVPEGEEDYTNDAGLVTNQASIGDFVFVDANGNGVQDPSEEGIPSVPVKLFTAGGLELAQTSTDANGMYLFENLEGGQYYVQFCVADDFIPTPANNGNEAQDSDVTGANGPNTTDDFELVAGVSNFDVDAGFYQCATICGNNWIDVVVNNEYRDPTENGINGMEVNLYKREGNTWTLVETDITGLNPDTPSEDGFFEFCVIPGQYYLEFVLTTDGLVQVFPFRGPSNLDSDITNIYGLGTTNSFTVGNGAYKCDIGAGYNFMFQVGNQVWEDANLNGLRDQGEQPVGGIAVKAYNSSGVMIAETITDAQGQYNIDYLQQEDYYLKFESNGMSFTTPHQGDEEHDSDVDGSNGPNTTPMISGEAGVQRTNVDAGLVSAALPVNWLYVKGYHTEKENMIQWATSDEVNASYYELERSVGSASDFEMIARLEANGKATENVYTHSDQELRPGTHYYRIKQVDNNGRYEYSEMISLDGGRQILSIYPNPVANELNVYVSNADDELQVVILDQLGREVKQIKADNRNGRLSVDISSLQSGVYNVELRTLGSQSMSEQLRFIKI